MKRVFVFLLLSFSIPLIGWTDVLPRAGDVVFQSSFETPESHAAWSSADFAAWVKGYQESTSLQITVPPERSTGGYMINMPLDLTPYRGHQLLFECMAKADHVSKPPAPYFGTKYMVHYTSETDGEFWQNEMNVFGTFDWKKIRFTARIASDARDGEIILGLQESSGTVWFDDVMITVLTSPPARRPAPLENPPPAFKGHDLPRLRGVMSPAEWREGDIRNLGMEWNANVIRWQLSRNWGLFNTDRDLAEYDTWLDHKLVELDKVLAECRQYGVLLVIDMHSPPGGRYPNGELAIFHEKTYQDHWISGWEKIARRYKDHPAVWGYDLINEPYQRVPPPLGVADYFGAQTRVARAIRKIDPTIPVFIAPAESGSAEGFRELQPVDISNVIYQVHMYTPHEFTHQGVDGEWKPVAYPGMIADREWNKETIRKSLEPVREFQRAYNVHIYAGEFSAIRWAPGSAEYLRDCIDIFEEYGWDWSFHSYREWHGWSVDHGNDRNNLTPVSEPTDRKKLLLEWFGKNVKPNL